MKNFIVGTLIIGVAIIVGCMLIKPAIVNRYEYGASPGPDHYNMQYFKAGFIDGGDVTTLSQASTSAGTSTITAKQFIESKIITWDPDLTTVGTGASTTLFTSTTISTYFTSNGDSHEILFRNTGTGTSTFIAAGSGIDLIEPTGGDVLIGAGNDAVIECWRQTSLLYACSVDEMQDAD
ncbi:MAG: hypothetical protein U9O94_05205 [Nanoarchaeota archaeon]|nr:hypothetical protein [Nanoarchaeota archaeon]